MASKKSRVVTECDCSAGTFIVAAIIMALGLFALVWGVSTQWIGGAGTALTVIPAYIIGILLIGAGRLLKVEASGSCRIHLKK